MIKLKIIEQMKIFCLICQIYKRIEKITKKFRQKIMKLIYYYKSKKKINCKMKIYRIKPMFRIKNL